MPKKGGLAKKCKEERATQKLFHPSNDGLIIRLIGKSFKVKEAKLLHPILNTAHYISK
jgi:hypothetical protein